jgi:hypothetical protein
MLAGECPLGRFCVGSDTTKLDQLSCLDASMILKRSFRRMWISIGLRPDARSTVKEPVAVCARSMRQSRLGQFESPQEAFASAGLLGLDL